MRRLAEFVAEVAVEGRLAHVRHGREVADGERLVEALLGVLDGGGEGVALGALAARFEEEPPCLHPQHPHHELLHAEVDQRLLVGVVLDEEAGELADRPLEAGRVVEVADLVVLVDPVAGLGVARGLLVEALHDAPHLRPVDLDREALRRALVARAGEVDLDPLPRGDDERLGGEERDRRARDRCGSASRPSPSRSRAGSRPRAARAPPGGPCRRRRIPRLRPRTSPGSPLDPAARARARRARGGRGRRRWRGAAEAWTRLIGSRDFLRAFR